MLNYPQLRWTWINPSDKTLNGLSSMISEKKIYFEEKRINFEKKSYFLPLLPPLISFNTLPTLTIFIILQCPFTSNEWYYQQQEVINIWVLAQIFLCLNFKKKETKSKKTVEINWSEKNLPQFFFSLIAHQNQLLLWKILWSEIRIFQIHYINSDFLTS